MKKSFVLGALVLLGVACDGVLGIERAALVQDESCRKWRCAGDVCGFVNEAAGLTCDSVGVCNEAGECKKAQGFDCSVDSDCATGRCRVGICCDPETCKKNGEACQDSAECLSGYCVEGVCCNSQCGATCVACTGAQKGQGSDGLCGPIVELLDPQNECSLGGCDGAGACQKPEGQACLGTSECASGHCVDGVCCDSPCEGACFACTVDATGKASGVCAPVLAALDPRGGCNDGACDGYGTCKKHVGQACMADAECLEGVCNLQRCAGPSCAGLPPTCAQWNGCCATSVVPGGSFHRSNDPAYPATVGDFRLDIYEVTVGRFRKFVEAYPSSMPAVGAGAHPSIANSGWDASWTAYLPPSRAALRAALNCWTGMQTWTDTVDVKEHHPITCVSWYEAFAFCAWDGGRLPTEAEWNYAAAGGDKQRVYPWGAVVPNSTYAVYDCMGDGSLVGDCTEYDIRAVGSRSPGDGRWGHADLGGSLAEWTLDADEPGEVYFMPCTDCAKLEGKYRTYRGGSWADTSSNIQVSRRAWALPTIRGTKYGFRCARNP